MVFYNPRRHKKPAGGASARSGAAALQRGAKTAAMTTDVVTPSRTPASMAYKKSMAQAMLGTSASETEHDDDDHDGHDGAPGIDAVGDAPAAATKGGRGRKVGVVDLSTSEEHASLDMLGTTMSVSKGLPRPPSSKDGDRRMPEDSRKRVGRKSSLASQSQASDVESPMAKKRKAPPSSLERQLETLQAQYDALVELRHTQPQLLTDQLKLQAEQRHQASEKLIAKLKADNAALKEKLQVALAAGTKEAKSNPSPNGAPMAELEGLLAELCGASVKRLSKRSVEVTHTIRAKFLRYCLDLADEHSVNYCLVSASQPATQLPPALAGEISFDRVDMPVFLYQILKWLASTVVN